MRRESAPWFEMLFAGKLRIGCETARNRKGRTARNMIQSADRARFSDTNARSKQATREFSDAAELRTAAGQNNAAARQI